ncbi:MAG: hypothetical protein KAT91_04815, partial [Candidatus Aenigmarchaeota archaeon]|nr:hypothetical protein [Candidatus Aenigmarchaeota archaeon]
EFLNEKTRDIITEAEEGLRKAIIDGYKITGTMPGIEFEGLGVSDNDIQMDQAQVLVNEQKQRIATKNISDTGSISNKVRFKNILFEKDNVPFYFDAEMNYILNIKEQKRTPIPKRSSAISNLYIELKENSTPQDVFNAFNSVEIKEIERQEGIEVLGAVDVLGKQRIINEPYNSTANGGLLLQMTAESEKDIQNITKYINGTLKSLMEEYGMEYRFLEETPEKISDLDKASLRHIAQQITPSEKANA